jgi:hypothetical protein
MVARFWRGRGFRRGLGLFFAVGGEEGSGVVTAAIAGGGAKGWKSRGFVDFFVLTAAPDQVEEGGGGGAGFDD